MKKIEFIRSIVSILAADGKIVQQEKQFLAKLCKRFNISQEDISRILSEAKQGNREIHIPTDNTEKRILYKLLLQAACSDGIVSAEEQVALETFAIKIGMTATDVQNAVAIYLKEMLPSSQKTGIVVMNIQQQMLRKEVLSWKDRYKTQIDEVLTDAYPHLESRLKEVVSNNAIEMLKGGPKKFTKELLEPEIITWVKQHTESLIHQAQKDLTQIITHTFEHTAQFYQENLVEGGSSLGTDLLAPLVAILAGIGTMVAGVIFGISTFLWFFTMINWPILIGGFVVGGALSLLGVVKLSQIKEQILTRFSNIFLPKIRDALIGEGYEHEKQHYPSLSMQLQESIEHTTRTILQQVRT